ncbi:TPR-like protein [Laetiporus sulphureus 93-53]|uniref:TPR-like protein n=1 Tax=Laetiporus sulphureus 93-53 TaxID=1314785 RepID=A0A165BL69_9APHY|nr:TPR-like protein [Laetiporus sulphureus 93-53]KZT01257.1 TPR-like protein [Laetiporus sulphureus 93-53]
MQTLAHLSQELLNCYHKSHLLNELNKMIIISRIALQLVPDNHEHKWAYWGMLADALNRQFQHTRDLTYLDQAIAAAVQLTSNNPEVLNNLGIFFSRRFRHFNNLADVDLAIAVWQKAMQLTPDDNAKKPHMLNNLGNSFSSRSEYLGNLTDVEQAIAVQQRAVQLTSDDHADKPGMLTNLGASFCMRFEHLGDFADVEQAIAMQQKALTPDDHAAKPGMLNNLGASFFWCFKHIGNLADINQVITVVQQAVQLTPDGHANKPGWLSNLGAFFSSRFDHVGDLADVNQAITMLQKAVKLTPDNHSDKPDVHTYLGNSFNSRFDHFRNLADIEEAIAVQQKAVQMTPDNHADKRSKLTNLGNAFFSRFKHLDNLADLHQAIDVQQKAVQLTPDDHADKPSKLNSLGNSFFSHFQHLLNLADVDQAMIQYSLAAKSSTGPFSVRFHAGQKWIQCAHALQHSSLFEAYNVTLTLLPNLAWLGLPFSDRYGALTQAASLARDAAATAIQFGHYNTAVEWLEQGRSIVWEQQLQLRTPFDDLQTKHPTLASKISQISKQLEQASYRLDKQEAIQETLEKEAQQHRALAQKWELLLAEVRSMLGFEQFLMPKKLAQLLKCAHSGPVIILNCSQLHCDALLIVSGSKDVIHLSLDGLTYQIAQNLELSLNSLLRNKGRIISNDRAAKMEFSGDGAYSSFESILSELWSKIVKPVLDRLDYQKQTSTCSNLSQIFWCPTGPLAFLPIHAAGIYGKAESNVKLSEFAISSYTPTLSALILPSEDNIPQNIHLLAVAQPSSDGQFFQLPGTQEEISKIKDRLNRLNSMQVLLVESDGRKDDVLDKLQKCSWVHFACHGIQDSQNPVNSGLQLANNQRLKLSDIVRVTHPQGGLAFLSACQTATGDKKLADEAVHLAARMLFIGYSGVIATMWSILDDVAPQVAEDVYSQLFTNDSPPDHRQAARALHYAVERLQQDPNMLFYKWLPFIHLGL